MKINCKRSAWRISHPIHLLLYLISFIFLSLTLTGCVTLSDPEASQEYNSNSVGIVDNQTRLGQTFVSRRPNLNGITIWLTTLPGQDNELGSTSGNLLNIELFHATEDTTSVFATTIIIPTSGQNLPIFIAIPDQKNPAGQSYYLLLTKDAGAVQINGRNEDAYPNGQSYINEQPANADIAFRLSYNYDLNALIVDINYWAANVWILIPLLIILWLPGWLLLDISGLRKRFDLGEQIALSNGISLAIIPVLMLWTTTFKFKWTSDRVLFCAGFITALLFIRIGYKYSTSLLSKRDREKQISKENYPQEKNTRRKSLGATTALLSIFIFSLAIRLIMIRDLATPAWVDSVHHALITRIILENGSYPSTYLPYWDIYPTAYHPGFHSIVATFTWMTNLNIAKALLLLGQFLNALCIFSVYLLTTSLTKNTKAGLFAALITGCLTPMPAYYTSWGRYTQLAGLLILPVIIALLRLIQEEKIRRKLLWVMLIGSISAGGLFLVHYRVIVFLFCLLLSYFLFQSLTLRKYKLYIPFRFIIIISAIAILAILIISPWFLPTVKNTLLPALTAISDGSVSFFHDFSWQYLTSALGKQAIAFAGLGLIWGMINRKKFTLTLIFWIFLLFLIANFDALKLPGGGLINNTSVEIILFIPISILGGYFIAQMIASWTFLINKRWLIILFTLIIIPTSAIAYTGAKQLIPIINPVTILSRNADLPAIDWIGKHVPADEVIVINPFPWGYGLYAGNDGGYWISPLSGRMTLPPPILYGLESRRSNINEASQEVITLGNDSLGLWEYLKSQNLNYVFIGAKGGAIAPQALANSGLFTVLYHEDGVWILNRKP